MKHYRQKNCDVIIDKFIQFVPMASSWLPAGINVSIQMFFTDIYYTILTLNTFPNIKKLNLCMGEGRVYLPSSIFTLKLSFFNVFFLLPLTVMLKSKIIYTYLFRRIQ